MYTDSISNKSGIKQIEIGTLVTITIFYKNTLSKMVQLSGTLYCWLSESRINKQECFYRTPER